MTIWYTADLHFGHKSIISLCNRPFGSVEEMDETLIRRWNAKVGPKDTVWVIGDFAYRTPLGRKRQVFSQLKGQIRLITLPSR